MNVLIIGSGGREHALAWKLSREGHQVTVAPGNPGMKKVAKVVPVALADRRGLLDLAEAQRPDFILIGPEDPLISGLGDLFREFGYAVFGPGQAAARLEGSKSFSKDLMKRAGVPTADGASFTDPVAAKKWAAAKFESGRGVVIKASGNALGKGVFVCDTLAQAEAALDACLVEGKLGEAGRTVVAEERLVGREFSLLTLVSEGGFFSLPVAQDYKRVGDGDTGPNTGGMGTVSPCLWVSPELVARCEEEVVAPILRVLGELEIPYRGVLFSGLMVENPGTAEAKPYCLEYNVRFGDPETQSVMMRLGEGFGDALHRVANGEAPGTIATLDQSVVTVVAASGGYPGDYEKGVAITFGEPGDGVEIFHAGTARQGDEWVTNGGRVVAVTASGSTPEEARDRAYAALDGVQFAGKIFRRDIGR